LKFSCHKQLLLLLLVLPLFGQHHNNFLYRHYFVRDTLFIQNPDTLVQLAHSFINPGSLELRLVPGGPLQGDYYDFNASKGHLRLKLTQSPQKIYVGYAYIPGALPLRFYNSLKQVKIVEDSVVAVQDSADIRFEQQRRTFQQLNKSGTISRGITIGTNRSLTLQSGLNFQISGKLTEKLFIEASLTDENTPIQPEGNTQQLREIDKVFIRVKAPHFGGVIGDYFLEQTEFRLNPFSRKIKGLELSGNYGGHNGKASYATADGQFHSNDFVGTDGNQGPYLLRGKNGETDIVVLGGTEKVYLDGIALTRGENQDYIIDYSAGEIRFTASRPITANNRIAVDFEYTSFEQRFQKDYLRGYYKWQPTSAFKVQTAWFREADNKNQVVTGSDELTAQEIAIIAGAGDDPTNSFVSGATRVEQGIGSYRDSLLVNSGDTIYVWTGRNNGNFVVQFSDVGAGNGSYNRQAFGYYEYVGINKGRYLPIKRLPLPTEYQAVALSGAYDSDDIRADMEINLSDYDQNTFSQLNDNDNGGLAGNFNFRADRIRLPWFGMLSLTERLYFKSSGFQKASRLERPDYQNQWNLISADPQTGQQNLEAETGITLRPGKTLTLGVDHGLRHQLNDYMANRLQTRVNLLVWDSLRIAQNSRLVQTNYSRTNNASATLNGDILLQKKISKWTFTAQGEGLQNKESLSDRADKGYRKLNSTAKAVWQQTDVTASLRARIEQEQAVLAQSWQRMTNSWDTNIEATFNGLAINGRINWFHREKTVDRAFNLLTAEQKSAVFNPLYVDTTLVSQKSDLIRTWLNYRKDDWNLNIDLTYEAGSEQTPIIEKFYFAVDNNVGNYLFDSTLAEWIPDPNGTHLLLQIPTGRFEPITRVNTDLNIDWQGRNIFPRYKVNNSFWYGLLDQLRMVTGLSIDEKTKYPDRGAVFLFLPSAIQTDSTFSGNLAVRNDLYWYYNKERDFLQLKSRYTESIFRQFLDAIDNDKRLTRDYQLLHQMRWGLAFKNDARLIYTRKVRGGVQSRFSRENITIFGAEEKLTWRFWKQWQIAQTALIRSERNSVTDNAISILYNQLRTELTIPWAQKGRTYLYFRRYEVTLNEADTDAVIPFGMADGKRQGVSLDWGLRVAYAINQNIHMNLNYTGRKDRIYENVLHTGQAEIKAFF
jgi:hypothetical protein